MWRKVCRRSGPASWKLFLNACIKFHRSGQFVLRLDCKIRPLSQKQFPLLLLLLLTPHPPTSVNRRLVCAPVRCLAKVKVKTTFNVHQCGDTAINGSWLQCAEYYRASCQTQCQSHPATAVYVLRAAPEMMCHSAGTREQLRELRP